MVSDAYAYRNGSDSAFWDDSDMIKCDACNSEYDYKEYNSLTCSECESELIEKVKAIVKDCPTCNESEGK